MSPLESIGIVFASAVMTFGLMTLFDVRPLRWIPWFRRDRAGKDVEALMHRDHALEVMKSWQGEEK